MKKKSWINYLFWIILMELTALCTWWVIAEGIAEYQNTAVPAGLAPSEYVFLVVWGVLFGLMGVSMARIRTAPVSRLRETAIGHFVTQLVLNFFWGQVFFCSQAFGFALVWLIVMLVFVVLMIRDFLKIDKLAGILQIPYLVWTVFALWLNYSVWILN